MLKMNSYCDKDNIVKNYTQKIKLKIRPWGEDSVLPNLFYESFYNTYPYNYNENILSEIEEREFSAMIIENEYLKVTIIPELGARLFSVYDKLANKEVFNMPEGLYPCLIYLRGTFIPVGIEFNYPHGHTVHAVESLPCEFVKKEDEKSIVMHLFNAVTKIDSDITISLKRGERKVTTQIRLKNTLPIRNGFMYWSNAAVEQTPELTMHVTGQMSHFFDSYNTFPDIDGRDSRIAKNRLFASDFFVVGCKERWFGFSWPERGNGCAHIGDSEQLKGKKFFTWGFDDYAFRWGRYFGCSEYGYVEFQAGILETQFEHTHLEPFEERFIQETWFPYSGMPNISYADENFIFQPMKANLG